MLDVSKEKTKAVCYSKTIDTIILADKENIAEAKAVIDKEGVSEKVAVKEVSTLKEVDEIRSQLADELIDYCDKLIEKLNPTPWHRKTGEKVKISEIAIPTRVIKVAGVEAKNIEADIESGSNSSRIEIDEESREPINFEFRDTKIEKVETLATPSIDPLQAKLCEDSGSGDDDAVNWEKVFPSAKGELIILRGGPGHGKTVHSKYEIIKAAEHLSDELKRKKLSLDKISKIPVWLPLVELANSVKRDVSECIVENVFVNLNLNYIHFSDYLKAKLPESSIIFFDGFDELDSSQTESMKEKFRLMKNWTSQRCVTCRLGNYKVDELADSIVEYHLASFRGDWLSDSKLEIEKFVKKWFNSNEEKAKELLGILKQNYALHNQCRSPLLLTFTCLEHQSSKVTESTTCANLFESVVDNLLRKTWRYDPKLSECGERAFGVFKEDGQIDSAWRLLPHMSYNLINADSPRNRFTGTEIIKAMERTETQLHNSSAVIEWFERKGILVRAGQERRNTYYSFAHRALLEFLVALHLTDTPNYIEILEQKVDKSETSTDVGAWCYILPPLVGLVDDPKPIIRLLIRLCKDEKFEDSRKTASQALLICLLECKNALDKELREDVFEVLIMTLDQAQFALRQNQWQFIENKQQYLLAQMMAAAEKQYDKKNQTAEIFELVDKLKTHFSNISKEEKEKLKDKLGSFRKVSELTPPERWSLIWASVVLKKEASIKYLEDSLSDKNAAIRALAVRALPIIPGINKENLISLLKDILQKDSADYTKNSVLATFGNIKNKNTIPYIKEYLSPQNQATKTLKVPAMYALSQFNDKNLLGIFKAGLDDEVDSVQASAISGLSGLRDTSEFEKLADLLKNSPSAKVRRSVAWAFGNLKLKKAIHPLIEGTADSERDVAMMCYQSINRYGLALAEDTISDFLKRATNSQKSRFAYSWKLAAERQYKKNNKDTQAHFKVAARFCLYLMEDEDAKVRETACWAFFSLLRARSLKNDRGLKFALAKKVLLLLSDKSDSVQKIAFQLFITLVRYGFGKSKNHNRFIRSAIDKTLNLLSVTTNQDNKIAGFSLLIELTKSRNPVLLRNKSLISKVIGEIIKLSLDSYPKLKQNVLRTIETLMPFANSRSRPLLNQKIADICLSLLQDGSVDIRVDAITTLSNISYSTAELNSSFVDKLQVSAIELLDDLKPEINAADFWMLSELLKTEYKNSTHRLAFLHDEAWTKKLIGKIQQKLSESSSDSVITYALRTLRFLLPYPVLQNDSETIVQLVNKCLNLIDDYLPLKIKGQALKILDMVFDHKAIRSERNIHKQIAYKCLRVLDDIQIDRLEKDLYCPFVQSTGIILLQKVLVESLADEKELIHDTLEHCKSLFNSQDESVTSSALRTCEAIIMDTDISHESIIKESVEQSLKQLTHPSAMVRATVLGVFIKCAPIIKKDAELTLTLFKETHNSLRNPDANVKSSALIVLDKLLVETQVRFDKVLCQDLINQCFRLLNNKEEPQVRSAALMTLEKVLIQPSIRENFKQAKLVVDRCLILLK